MSDISRAALFGKLNRYCFGSVESATVFCKLRGNPQVELAHLLHQLLQSQDGDLHRIVHHYGVEPARLARDLTEALERLPRGGHAHLDFSAELEEAVERAWTYCTLRYGQTRIRSGHLLVGMLQTRTLRNALLGLSAEFGKLRREALTDALDTIVAGSPEDAHVEAAPAEDAAGQAAPGGQGDALVRFTVDLTAQARQGAIDPVVGRDAEIRQVVDILMRRRQNNPMLVGEAGVGKTAVVEGFAQRIVAGDVPPALREVEVRTLDVGLLQAGASVKGEFENRLRQVIDQVQASPRAVILFIDEAHTLMGAGGNAGTGDAANLLKPALARGTLRTIGATTWAEYKRHVEKDPALTRRFQTILVDEPDEQRAVLMLRGSAAIMERHHRVQILDEALVAAVALSHRYIPARQLPDKAISLLDTACARVGISQHAVPAAIDDARKSIQALETELAIIEREQRVGIAVDKRLAGVQARLAAERAALVQRESDWAAEQALVERVLALRAKLRGSAAEDPPQHPAEHTATASESPSQTRAEDLQALAALQAQLDALQGETPLILPSVDHAAVAAVVADWTGIPVGRMLRSELDTVMRLPQLLGQRVLGQGHAMEAIARRIQTARAGLDNPAKPVGVFLLAGPSGVGKTETALALAEALYGGEGNLITINMSEFQEAHTVSTLKGAPPGYVGYGEGGVLTEAVRRKPHSVVLLDEVEKAHPDVHEVFFQVFDKGQMEDGEGRMIDFRNTLILLTTNVGTERIQSLCGDPALMPDAAALSQALHEPLRKTFPAALLGRMTTVAYHPLDRALLGDIVRLQMRKVAERIAQRYAIPMAYDAQVIELIVSRCTQHETGGRMIDSVLTQAVLPEISRRFIQAQMAATPLAAVRIEVKDGDFHYRFEHLRDGTPHRDAEQALATAS
jgi:type VI secretion system protein VasG